ncbi:unnamed protein product [Clonostachys solani]|uniref:Tetratricopeptide repeat protein n=1 Tax=Clonostachys solani TaxID=160281 RepID=A0A9P0EPL4_9HYPO|nr:unnamed protein product [Clonostachys solani]
MLYTPIVGLYLPQYWILSEVSRPSWPRNVVEVLKYCESCERVAARSAYLLAATLNESGAFDEAVKAFQQALEISSSIREEFGPDDISEAYLDLFVLYSNG